MLYFFTLFCCSTNFFWNNIEIAKASNYLGFCNNKKGENNKIFKVPYTHLTLIQISYNWCEA